MDAAVPNEFVVGGRVRRVEGEEQDRLAREWSWDVGDAAAFEFRGDEAILGERASDDDWPPHYSTWRAER
jgi:hypothetical protein